MVKNDPFFGDAVSSTVRAALHIYDNRLGTIFYPLEHDPGHPTLYAWLLAACWLLFGKTLFVSHLFSVCWTTAIGLLFVKLASRYLQPHFVLYAALLLSAFPTWLSQSAMMLNTAAFMFFVLLAFYGFVTGNKKWQYTGMVVMMLLHTQSTFFLLGFAIAHFTVEVIIKKEKTARWLATNLLLFLLPFLVYVAWLYAHIRHTGWAFHSPNYTDADHLNNATSFIKSILIIIWRLIDFGMLPVYLVLMIAVFKKWIARTELLMYTIPVLLVNMVVMAVFLENTIGHRYFLVFQFMAMLLALMVIQSIAVSRQKIMVVVLFVSLVAGNYLYYPGKTLGDASLAYRDYFELEKQISNEFNDTLLCYSYAPLANEAALTRLSSNGLRIERIRNDQLNIYPVILQSNVNAEFTAEQKALLHTWPGTSYEKGAVYVNLFFNPDFYEARPEWRMRQPGAFELWFSGIKQKVKE